MLVGDETDLSVLQTVRRQNSVSPIRCQVTWCLRSSVNPADEVDFVAAPLFPFTVVSWLDNDMRHGESRRIGSFALLERHCLCGEQAGSGR